MPSLYHVPRLLSLAPRTAPYTAVHNASLKATGELHAGKHESNSVPQESTPTTAVDMAHFLSSCRKEEKMSSRALSLFVPPLAFALSKKKIRACSLEDADGVAERSCREMGYHQTQRAEPNIQLLDVMVMCGKDTCIFNPH